MVPPSSLRSLPSEGRQCPDAFVKEVSDARIHGGIHFRAATDAGEAMGKRIGELAADRVLRAGMH
jgi:hypothetical protein